MKKIIYLFAFIGLVFTTACNPMDDINAEVDAQLNPIVGDATYTLTDDDYSDLGLTYGSFSSEADAKTMLPSFLSSLYPVWGKGSGVLVGYKLYVGSAPGVSDYTYADVFTLAKADYAASGSSIEGYYPDKDPADYLPDVLAANFPAAADGDVELVKYTQYTEVPTVTTIANYVLDENFNYGSTAGDLTTVSGGTWSNHSGAANELMYATSSLTMTDYPSSDIGGSIEISSSGSEDVNSVFSPISSGVVYSSALVNLSSVGSGTYFLHFMDESFGYTARVGAKSSLLGKVLFGIGATSSTLTYGTTEFDLNTTYLLVASYNIDNGESNLYVLTTAEATEPATPEATNTGDAGKLVTKVGIRQGSGGPSATIDGVRVATTWADIMVNEILGETIDGDKETYQTYYKFNGSSWAIPTDMYVLTTEDYDAMGTASGEPGKYNNFDSSMEIDNYISTFLTLKYPYAQEEASLIVIYKYYSSSAHATQTRGNLYTVTNGVWTGFESTISTTLQFGHDGTKWVPDNTIKYTLTGADYAWIAAEYAVKYAGNVATLINYQDFDYNWTDEMILDVLNGLLKHNFPGMAEGQKFAVTYLKYDGGAQFLTMYVILQGGDYVLQ
ncbi:MAG: hypothetical protein JW857_08480 [Bacteroidales bacterium]|nr:hypothetical protein [Bacteroidales bacterium]